MAIGNVLTSIFSSGAEKVVSAVGDAFAKNFTTEDEREKNKTEALKEVNRHLEEINTQAQAAIDAELKDMQDARGREVQIATSDKAPLINKIITPVLAIFILTLCFGMDYAVLFKGLGEDNKEIIYTVLGSLNTMGAGVVAYYFGSSAGSKAKAETIDKMVMK